MCHTHVCANSIKWFLSSNKSACILLGWESGLLSSLSVPYSSHMFTHTHTHMQLLDLLSLNALLVLFEFIYQSSPDYNWQKAQLHTRHQRERDREKNKKQTDLETAGLTAKFWLTAALLHPSLELDGGGRLGLGHDVNWSGNSRDLALTSASWKVKTLVMRRKQNEKATKPKDTMFGKIKHVKKSCFLSSFSGYNPREKEIPVKIMWHRSCVFKQKVVRTCQPGLTFYFMCTMVFISFIQTSRWCITTCTSNKLLDLLHRNNTLLFIYYTRAHGHA